MAAGEGRRLRPLTERWPKPVLPIDGKPVIATLLRELAVAGIGAATVVTGHLAEQVEELVGDGSAFGVSVGYARQPEPLGSADAVRRALEGGASAPLLVVAADTVFRPGAVARVSREWLDSGVPAGLGVRRGGGEGKTPVRVEAAACRRDRRRARRADGCTALVLRRRRAAPARGSARSAVRARGCVSG